MVSGPQLLGLPAPLQFLVVWTGKDWVRAEVGVDGGAVMQPQERDSMMVMSRETG